MGAGMNKIHSAVGLNAITTIMIFASLFKSPVHADPVGDALNIVNQKNPIAAILQQNHACQLISPPSPQFSIQGKKVGPGAGGNITIPTILSDGVTVDLSS